MSELLSNSFNTVAFKLLSKCRELKKDENIIISPLSISLGLLSLAFGAKGKSRSEIGSLLQITSDPVNDEDLQALSLAFKDLGEGVKLANGLFSDKSFPISESYGRSLEKSLLPLETKSVNFKEQSQAAVNEINKWVEIATESKIKDFFSNDAIDNTVKFVLVNAIYFKGLWEEAFQQALTTKKTFHVNKNEAITVDMMQIERNFQYANCPELDCNCIEIPYLGTSVSCYILLPNKIEGLKLIDDNLTPDLFRSSIFERMAGNKRNLLLHLPKFKIECNLDLKEVLIGLGIGDVFQDGVADLSGFSEVNKGLFVSKAVHKAVIEVNEEGTEAAAATGFVGVCYMACFPPQVFTSKLFQRVITPNAFGKRHFWGWLNDVANNVDPARIEEVGPDRAAAEWLIRCGASVKWKGAKKFHSDYNSLPAGNFSSYKIEEIDGTESSIMSVGFPHLRGLTEVKVIKLIKCNYMDDPALPMLGFVKETLEKLEVSSCGNISDDAIKSLDRLKNLKSLYLFDLQQVKKPNECLEHLKLALKGCQIEFPVNGK